MSGSCSRRRTSWATSARPASSPAGASSTRGASSAWSSTSPSRSPIPSGRTASSCDRSSRTATGRCSTHAEIEAFSEEWDYVTLDYDTWRKRAFGPSGFDPGLAPVVWAGDEVVAFSRNYAKRNGNWGFVGTLGVRPAWRRRGLGLALLRESFRRFRETGETTVALGVDVENPTGATRLYERAGMHVLWQADVWQKELRAAG